MFEKVNPMHVDKVADRIGGALVDMAYAEREYPKVAGEILIGHKNCHIIIETDVNYPYRKVCDVVKRITKVDDIEVSLQVVPQDTHLAENQKEMIRCGDNGIFIGYPITNEERVLTTFAKNLYSNVPYDGKYVLFESEKSKYHFIICQSNMTSTAIEMLEDMLKASYSSNQISRDSAIYYELNPLGDWTGGTDVDTGACNRKLGSDMGRSVTGGGLHFKDMSKADVSVNIFCFLWAQRLGKIVRAVCSIGDENVRVFIGDDSSIKIPYNEIVATSRHYIDELGGFEKFAEWGLVR